MWTVLISSESFIRLLEAYEDPLLKGSALCLFLYLSPHTHGAAVAGAVLVQLSSVCCVAVCNVAVKCSFITEGHLRTSLLG